MSLSIENSIIPAHTKWAFVTRRVKHADVCALSQDFARARAGDLVLGQILKIGQHKRIQLTTGRPSEAYVGDVVVLACGDRYAPDQFEGIAQLDAQASDLLAGGGLIGHMRVANQFMQSPTQIKPLGLLQNRRGETMNVDQYKLTGCRQTRQMPVIGVVGASMNAGKTTTAASIAFGLRQLGFKVAALKITGTGAFGDFNAFSDAGCDLVADFTDAGMASTYRQPLAKLLHGFKVLLSHADQQGAEAVVVEIADGVYQTETAQLLNAAYVKEQFDAILFAAGEALSAVGGVHTLRSLGFEPLAVSGRVSCSPLAVLETKANAHVTVASRDELRSAQYLRRLLSRRLPALAQQPAPADDADALQARVA